MTARAALIILALVVASAYLVYSERRTEAATAFYTQALQDAQALDHVSVGGKTYDVRGGTVSLDGVVISSPALRVLALAYEKQLARRTPILSLPGIDIDALRAAIDSLERTQEHLSRIQEEDARKWSVLHLYPIDFLRAAGNAEQARRVFLEKGDHDSALRYRAATVQAVHAYIADLRDFEAHFVENVPESAGSYAEVQRTIKRSDMLTAIQSLSRAMQAQRTALDKRQRCIHGAISHCDPSEVFLAEIPPTAAAPLQRGTSSFAFTVREMLKSAKRGAGEFPPELVQLSSGDCAIRPDASIYVPLIEESPWSGLAFSHPLYAGDVRFLKPESARKTNFGDFLQESGVVYIYSPATTHYSCFSWSDEMSRIEAVRAVAEFAREVRISSITEDRQLRAEFLQLERALAKTDRPLQESDAASYLRAATRIDTSSIGAEALRRLETLILQWRDRSAAFDSFIHGTAKAEEINACLVEKGVPITLDARYLFFVRSGFTGLYMTARYEGADAFFSPHNIPLARQPYVLYSEIIARGAEARQASRDLDAYFDMHTFPTHECYL